MLNDKIVNNKNIKPEEDLHQDEYQDEIIEKEEEEEEEIKIDNDRMIDNKMLNNFNKEDILTNREEVSGSSNETLNALMSSLQQEKSVSQETLKSKLSDDFVDAKVEENEEHKIENETITVIESTTTRKETCIEETEEQIERKETTTTTEEEVLETENKLVITIKDEIVIPGDEEITEELKITGSVEVYPGEEYKNEPPKKKLNINSSYSYENEETPVGQLITGELQKECNFV